MIQQTKNLFSSKVVWFSIVQAVAGILATIYATDPSVATIGWVAILKSVCDFALRLDTTMPITGMKK